MLHATTATRVGATEFSPIGPARGASHGCRQPAPISTEEGPTTVDPVLRTALQPRWLALLALVLAVCVGFGWLGAWQLGVAKARGQAEALKERQNQQVVPIDDVLSPQRSFTARCKARLHRVLDRRCSRTRSMTHQAVSS